MENDNIATKIEKRLIDLAKAVEDIQEVIKKEHHYKTMWFQNKKGDCTCKICSNS